MNSYRLSYISVIALLLLGGLFGACTNPVDNDDEEHPGEEAAGLILMSGGEDLVRVEGGEVADTLFVPLGGTVDVDLEFLDEDGERFHSEDLEEGLALAWDVGGEAIVTIQATGAWSFVVQGDEAGETTMTVLLMHGDHHDFTTPEITVVVE